MDNKVIAKDDERSFLSLAQQRDKRERQTRLFEQAVGDEDVSRRTENTKHFHLGANRFQAVVFPESVHFRSSEGGEWQEIDNTLEETFNAQGRAVLRNRANCVQVEFPKEVDGGSLVSITSNGKTFAWRFEQEAQPVHAAVRTGAQMKQARLAAIAHELPKFIGRTLECVSKSINPSES